MVSPVTRISKPFSRHSAKTSQARLAGAAVE
jgi:hypothetical protein